MPDYYLISQIWLLLLLAAIVGFVVGYWLRRIFGRAEVKDIERTWSAKADGANDQVKSLTSARDSAEARLQELEVENKSLRERSAVAGTAGSTEEATLLRAELRKTEGRLAALSSGDAAGADNTPGDGAASQAERDLKWKDAQIRWRDQQIAALREEMATPAAAAGLGKSGG